MTTHMLQALNCWGCGKNFAPRSAMIIHLENGSCVDGWRIQHVNAIAEQIPEFAKNLIKERVPWLRAGAPRTFTWDEDEMPNGFWRCHLCSDIYTDKVDLTGHLQVAHAHHYPDVLRCPSCKCGFAKISELLQHIKTPRCSADYQEPSIAALMNGLQSETSTRWSEFKRPSIEYKLENHPMHPSQLLVKVGEAGSLSEGILNVGIKRRREQEEEGHSFRPRSYGNQSFRSNFPVY